MKKRKKRRIKKSVVLLFIILVLGSVGVYFLISNRDRNLPHSNFEKIKDVISTEKKKIKIIDETSKSRPIAVMINNHPAARPYHSGLQDAYLTYEIIVEGGYTRYMAIFRDQTTTKIGSVRSARHYFLDYAFLHVSLHFSGMEN